MQTVKEFGGSIPKISLHEFWLKTAPVVIGIILLTEMLILWNRGVRNQLVKILRWRLLRSRRWRMIRFRRKRIGDPEKHSQQEQALARPNSHEQPLADPPPPHEGEGSEGSSILPSNPPPPSKEQRQQPLRSRNERHSGNQEVDKLQSLNPVYAV